MKMITTRKTLETIPSVHNALGFTPKATAGSAAVLAATVGSFVATDSVEVMIGAAIAMPCLWILSLAASHKTNRLTPRVLALKKLANKTGQNYNDDISDVLLDNVNAVSFMKGMFGKVSIPFYIKSQIHGTSSTNLVFVMEKGEMRIEEHNEVSAVEMWDRALTHSMTDDEKAKMPTHFTDADYCKLNIAKRELQEEFDNAGCQPTRFKLRQKMNDPHALDDVKFACGCKDCTPTFLRCSSCDQHSGKCSCLQSEKHGAIVNKQAISA